MAPWHRNLTDGKACLCVIGVAALVCIGTVCWIVQKLFLRCQELIP